MFKRETSAVASLPRSGLAADPKHRMQQNCCVCKHKNLQQLVAKLLVPAELITLTLCHRQHHRLNTLSPLTSALGSEALYEAGVQVSRGKWLLFSENLLAGYVWLQANGRLPSQEVQHGHWGDHEPGRNRIYGGWQGLQGKHQERVGVRWELTRLLSHGPSSRWVKEWRIRFFHWAVLYCTHLHFIEKFYFNVMHYI